MSQNRRNNHYHYAEKFEDRRTRAARKQAFMPFKAVIASLVVLLMFGLVSTTFGAYVVETEPASNPDAHPIISEVRNIKASRDVAVTGADVDLAATSGNVSGGYVYFEAPSGWDTANYPHVQFCLYQGGYLWCSDDMTNIAGTRVWCGSAPNHSSWNNEQIMFFANSSHYGSGNYDGTNAHYYTAKRTQTMSSGTYYYYKPSGSSNPYTNNAPTTGTSAAAVVGVYNQKANIYTKTTSTGSYSSSGTGGNVEITAHWLDIDNHQAPETTTPSSNGDTSIQYDNAVKNTSVTFKATANNGYRFVGWFSSTSATTATSTSTSYTISSITSANTLYARFIKQVTLKVQKATSTTYNGDPPVFDTSTESTLTSKKVDVGTKVTLKSRVGENSGVSVVWRTSNSATGTVALNGLSGEYTVGNSNTTLYTFYTLAAPTFTSYSYTSPITVGGTSSLTKTVSSATGGDSGLSYTYTATPINATANDANATSSSWSFDSSGNFTPTIPGEYRITVSVKDVMYGLESESVSMNTATVTVRPQAPAKSLVSWTIEGWTDDYTVGTTGTTYNQPIKVPIRSEQFKITAWLTSTTTGYTYNWSNKTGSYNQSSGAISAISGAVTKTAADNRVIDLCADSGSALIVNSDGYYAYQMSVTATYNGVSSEATAVDPIYYNVISDFLDIQYMSFTADTNDYQKIYAEDNGIQNIVSKIRAGGTTFNTFSAFSKDNINYNTIEAWTSLTYFENTYGRFTPTPNDAAHQTSDLQQSFDVEDYINPAGTKWFRIYMNDTGTGKTASATRYIHTTVGTSSTVANRPIYYKDATTNSYANSRVMAFYVESSDTSPTVHYQTGQAVKDGSNNIKYYRFYIPSDATTISFAHVSNENYVLPTYSSGAFSYTLYTNATVLMAWTETVDLTSAANYGKTMYKATAYTTGANSIKNYTGTMTTLD